MIKTIRHKGLRLFYDTGKESGIMRAHATKLRHILIALDSCTAVTQLNLPGLNLHKLKGREKDYYAVSVSGNWRVIFKFDGKHVTDVDYLDYH